MNLMSKFVGILLMIIIKFFMAVFFTVPLVQSMWKMLVMPSYPHALQAGYVYFFILSSTLVKFKIGEHKPMKDTITHIVSYYISVFFAWGFAHLYVNFL